jgi:hypothetical protein
MNVYDVGVYSAEFDCPVELIVVMVHTLADGEPEIERDSANC